MDEQKFQELVKTLESTQDELNNTKQELNKAKDTIGQLNKRIEELSVANNVDNNQIQQIIDNQNILIDYFVPSEEELKKQEEEQKKQDEELIKLAEEEEKALQEETDKELEFRQNVLTEIKAVNESVGNVRFETSNTNAYMYIVCLAFLIVGTSTFIYKMIKKFMHY